MKPERDTPMRWMTAIGFGIVTVFALLVGVLVFHNQSRTNLPTVQKPGSSAASRPSPDRRPPLVNRFHHDKFHRKQNKFHRHKRREDDDHEDSGDESESSD